MIDEEVQAFKVKANFLRGGSVNYKLKLTLMSILSRLEKRTLRRILKLKKIHSTNFKESARGV